MPKIIPEMLEIGRPPRLERAWRRPAAYDAIQMCCHMLDAILNERFPKRIAWPEELAAKVEKERDEFYEEVAFLFDIAAFRGLQEEPTQSVYTAFLRLLESDTVHNVQGGHEYWDTWFAVHFGDFDIYRLFDKEHAAAVNPDNDPDIAAMFFRAYELLRRLNIIAYHVEDPISTDIIDIMPEVIRLSLAGGTIHTPATSVEPSIPADPVTPIEPVSPVKYDKPWLLMSEGYVVYRYRLADALGLSKRTLYTYEKNGKSIEETFWPSPINPDDRHGEKYYDPLKVLDALSALPNDFSKKASMTEIIDNLMNNKLSSKLAPKKPKKVKKETDEETIRLEKEKLGWKDRFPT